MNLKFIENVIQVNFLNVIVNYDFKTLCQKKYDFKHSF